MKTLTQLIKQNKFKYINNDITKVNFPDDGRRLKDYKLFHFDKCISSEDAIKEMEKEGYVPANPYELLEWKDWNSRDWVVALGSVWRDFYGDRRVACLYGDGSKRRLYLDVWGGVWRGCYRFLAVCKSDTKKLDNSDSVLERLEGLEDFKSRVEKVLKL